MTDETLVDIGVDREATTLPTGTWLYGVNPAGGGADLVISKENLIIDVSDNFTRCISGVVADPNGWYTAVRAQIEVMRAKAAITITRIHIHGPDSTPTAEMALDLKFADDVFTGSFANAAVIDVCDTTSGAFTATSSFTDATVPANKYIYWQLDAAPHVDWKEFFYEIHYTYD